MEIKQGLIARFAYKDASILVRAKASDIDRKVFEAMKQGALRTLLEGGSPRISRDMASLFVYGWEGVELAGRPVPYSWPLLEQVMEPEAVDELAKFVSQTVDILK
jgi:hypothetical protein